MTAGDFKELQELAAQAAKQAERVEGRRFGPDDVVISKKLLKSPEIGMEVWASVGKTKSAPASVSEKGAVERLIGVLGSRSSYRSK